MFNNVNTDVHMKNIHECEDLFKNDFNYIGFDEINTCKGTCNDVADQQIVLEWVKVGDIVTKTTQLFNLANSIVYLIYTSLDREVPNGDDIVSAETTGITYRYLYRNLLKQNVLFIHFGQENSVCDFEHGTLSFRHYFKDQNGNRYTQSSSLFIDYDNFTVSFVQIDKNGSGIADSIRCFCKVEPAQVGNMQFMVVDTLEPKTKIKQSDLSKLFVVNPSIDLQNIDVADDIDVFLNKTFAVNDIVPTTAFSPLITCDLRDFYKKHALLSNKLSFIVYQECRVTQKQLSISAILNLINTYKPAIILFGQLEEEHTYSCDTFKSSMIKITMGRNTSLIRINWVDFSYHCFFD